MSDQEWFADLVQEELEQVYQRIAQAEGLIGSALETLDGTGDDHQERLAEAYSRLAIEEVSFNSARQLADDAGADDQDD